MGCPRRGGIVNPGNLSIDISERWISPHPQPFPSFPSLSYLHPATHSKYLLHLSVRTYTKHAAFTIPAQKPLKDEQRTERKKSVVSSQSGEIHVPIVIEIHCCMTLGATVTCVELSLCGDPATTNIDLRLSVRNLEIYQ